MNSPWSCHGGGVATMLLAILQHDFPMVLSWGHGHHVVGHFTTWLPHGHVMGGVAIMLLAILQHEFHMDPSAGRGTKNLFLANHMIFPCLSPLHGKFMDSSCGWPFYNMNLHVVKRPTTCCVWPGSLLYWQEVCTLKKILWVCDSYQADFLKQNKHPWTMDWITFVQIYYVRVVCM